MFTYGFTIGTFKYLFSHWLMVITPHGVDNKYGFIDVFLPTYLGALSAMLVFYLGSEYFMKRAANKRIRKYNKAIEKGIPFKPPKKFTRVNKLLVKIRSTFGIYAFTLLAPLFLSIPLGSIVCAKFYGNQKKTLPLMIFFTASYGVIMSLIMTSLYE